MKIHHIAITVNNLDESRKFYEDIFGFELSKVFEKKESGGKANYLKLGDVFLELWQFPDMKENQDEFRSLKIRGIRHIAFEVDNLEKTIFLMKEKGLTPSEPKFGASKHWYSFITDPNGVALELYQK
ncbi:MAG: VOC family protein [Candidatus Gracilibacteria bacterium]